MTNHASLSGTWMRRDASTGTYVPPSTGPIYGVAIAAAINNAPVPPPVPFEDPTPHARLSGTANYVLVRDARFLAQPAMTYEGRDFFDVKV